MKERMKERMKLPSGSGQFSALFHESFAAIVYNTDYTIDWLQGGLMTENAVKRSSSAG